MIHKNVFDMSTDKINPLLHKGI